MATYVITITVTYNDTTIENLEVEDVLVDNTVFAVERGLLIDGLGAAVVDDYEVTVDEGVRLPQ